MGIIAWARRLLAALAVPVAMGAGCVGIAGADPDPEYDAAAIYHNPEPLPVVVPVPDDWQPRFPFPFDQTQHEVTDAEINAEREMCQWFNAQYDILRHQIQGLNNRLIRANGHFDADGIQHDADIVTANIDQSMEFLTPRVQLLTQSHDRAGDLYFPLYQGDSFYGLWQQLFNVSNGIKARQPTWFTGPSYQRVLHWGSKINRSHVCR
ncbi:hypothetical protein BST36_23530 [Mycolicibacterium moriokaense]|nr:hypothetical protein [Mycolicibacterium moriokaense]MCV7039149.1 hypothetical protein [Mycolicibacterium moriokaense]ORB18594.1 hypothetical protein BST36_23530 [Mycolicibacterium moriokaense]